MGILSSLLLIILLALPSNLSIEELNISMLTYGLILLVSAKLLAKSLSLYILRFANVSACLISSNKSSLNTYIECFLLFCVFSSKSLNKAILHIKADELNSINLDLISHLASSIIIPFCSASLIVIVLCTAVSIYNDKTKGLILREINIICSSLLLVLGLFLILDNYAFR